MKRFMKRSYCFGHGLMVVYSLKRHVQPTSYISRAFKLLKRESDQNRKSQETGKHLRELKKNGGCPSQVYLAWCKCSSNCEFVIENHVGSFSFCGSVLYIELCKTLF